MAKKKPPSKPRGVAGTRIAISGRNGQPIVVGNPGNSGGKKGRSGRWPKEFHTFLSALREHPDTRAAIAKAASDPESRGFGPVLRALLDPTELTVVHPDVQLRIQQQVQLIASQANWESEALLARLADIWK